MIQNYIPKAIQPPKSDGYLELDKSSISSYAGASEDVTVSFKLSSGAVSAVSSDTDVCTVSVSGDVVTIIGVAEGEADVTITAIGDNAYEDASAVCGVEIEAGFPALNLCTPAQIQAAAQAGIGQLFWNIGDKTAPIIISASADLPNFTPPLEGVCAFILGFDHNSEYEGTGIHFQIGKTSTGTDVALVDSGYGTNYKTSGTWFDMNNSYSNSGGWDSSRMRNTICLAFLSSLPQEWQDVIATTTKYSDNTGGTSPSADKVTATSDKIWLLAEYEAFGVRNYANSAEQNYQKQYDYYKNGNSKIKYKSTETSTACMWWLRSVRASNSNSFCYVSSSGVASSAPSYYSYGFAPGFKIV